MLPIETDINCTAKRETHNWLIQKVGLSTSDKIRGVNRCLAVVDKHKLAYYFYSNKNHSTHILTFRTEHII